MAIRVAINGFGRIGRNVFKVLSQRSGVEVGAIANSLGFWSDGEPLLVMTSGAHRVDTVALASARMR